MKNLLIYISRWNCFDFEHETLVKIQIDNSLNLGWKREDVILITNFDYEYKGVKALVIGNENYCDFSPTVSKINAILTLFDKGIIKDELYWFHDFDAYQVEPITQTEIPDADIVLTDYGKMKSWNTGSIFFKKQAKDIFEKIKEVSYEYKTNEERALCSLTGNKTLIQAGGQEYIKTDDDLSKRVSKINISYNFQSNHIRRCYEIADKPIKVIHFHLIRYMIDFFINGKNKLQICLANDRLKSIFKEYNIV